MKKTIVALTLSVFGLNAFADQASYNALSGNVGQNFSGVNSAGRECAAAVTEEAVYVNLYNANLSEGFGMAWYELKKGWFSKKVVYTPTEDVLCKLLTPNHCGLEMNGKVVIETDSNGTLSEISFIASNKATVVSCKLLH